MAKTPTPTAATGTVGVVPGTTAATAPKFNFDPEQMRTRFHQITREKEAIRAKAQPLRTQYETLRLQEDDIRLKIQPISDQLKDIEGPLFDLSQEQATIARALGGKTGEDPVVLAQVQAENAKASTGAEVKK